jgi:hypothetical protein
MPAPSGIDETLKLEAVYLSAPIPRNLAVLTAMGAIFDKVYFPGVYLPKEGFDVGELDKEITRLEALPQDYDRQLLLGILGLTKHAKALAEFCEFTADPDDVFGTKSEPPQQLVRAIFEAIHGPPREGFTPMFDSGHSKGLPGGDEAVHYPGNHHYLARGHNPLRQDRDSVVERYPWPETSRNVGDRAARRRQASRRNFGR